MCGRTSCHLPLDVLTRACAYRDRRGRQRLPEWKDPDKYNPSYNKSPRSHNPVLLSRLHFEKNADSSERIIAPMRWGLVPSWFKDDLSKFQLNTSNCRSDTITEKRCFKVPLGKGRRCVVLADGFYEWQRNQCTNQRQPYFVYFPQIKTEKPDIIGPEDWEQVWDNWRLLTMAGIFDCWEPPEGGDLLYSYAIITVDSCPGLNDIHPRMPAILDGEEAVSKWLDFGEVSTQEALKLIHPTNNITFHPVSPVVNNSHNDTPQCVTPAHLMVIKKEPKASGSSQKMLQWLTSNSPKKEDPKPFQKESNVFQWSRHSLPKSNLPVKRGGQGPLKRWLKQEKQEGPVAKRPQKQ
ncbi:abasic site processing protein HMCES isoform X1 [Ochotona princeps]|uniref:abasic site processing protein HMCES isoform X1 n=1 Tax=Ochotona princeps TaxID=9978 RepID=UPI00271514F4|nr:abasic site processing protein HMCES isoform X1 [Ochotona princeps]